MSIAGRQEFFVRGSSTGDDSGWGGEALTLDAGADGTVRIPGGDFLLKADFSRAGNDLVLTGGDGRTITVHDYFAAETPPDLSTDHGAVISAELAARLAGPLAPGQYAQAGAGTTPQAIGAVTRMEGQVTVEHADGTKATLAAGDAVFQGDVLITGADGKLYIQFIDGTKFAMGLGARMVLDELIYDPSAHTGAASFSLVQGAFSFVSGSIAKIGPDAMTIKTPVATIGIRGTELLITVDQSGNILSVTMVTGPGDPSSVQMYDLGGNPIGDPLSFAGNNTIDFTPGQAPTQSNLTPAQIQQLQSQIGVNAQQGLNPEAGDSGQTTTISVTVDDGGSFTFTTPSGETITLQVDTGDDGGGGGGGGGVDGVPDDEFFLVPDAENQAPVLDLDADDSSASGPCAAAAPDRGFMTTFTEAGAAGPGSGPVAVVDDDVEITDVDNTTLDSAMATLTNHPDGADESLSIDQTALASIAGGAIVAVVAADGHSIALSGTASLDDYEAALKLLRYDNASDDPSTLDRTVDIKVNDGLADSNVAMTTINVVSSNDAPTDISLSNAMVFENAADGTVIGLLSGVDPDDTSLTFSLFDDAGGRFENVGSVLRVADGSLLDFESDTSHDITVRVTDPDGLFFDETFTIAVKNVAEGSQFTEFNSATSGGATTLATALLASIGGGLDLVAGSASFTGNTTVGSGSASTFTDLDLGTVNPTFALDDGILLTSGDGTPPLSNTSTSFSATASGAGDADLNALIGGGTADASALSFSFTVGDPNVDFVAFDFMYGSEEFPDQGVTDIAAVFVDGDNALTFADGSLVRFLNNTNEAFFTDNNQNNTGGTSPLSIEYDGVSAPATIFATLDAATAPHTLKVAVSDTSDSIFDSGLFIAGSALGYSWTDGDGAQSIDGGGGNDLAILDGTTGTDLFQISKSASTGHLDVLVNGVLVDLINVENVIIKGDNGADTLQIVGNLDGTGLDVTTITFDGGAGPDDLDASGLTSAHRIAADGGSGPDTFISNANANTFTGGDSGDFFVYLDPAAGTDVATDTGHTGVLADTITDFASGADRIQLDSDNFNFAAATITDGVNFEVLGQEFDGTNATNSEFLAGRDSLIVDSTGALIYDTAGAGYTVLVSAGADNVAATDVQLLNSFVVPE